MAPRATLATHTSLARGATNKDDDDIKYKSFWLPSHKPKWLSHPPNLWSAFEKRQLDCRRAKSKEYFTFKI
jgi:hypothetical protein